MLFLSQVIEIVDVSPDEHGSLGFRDHRSSTSTASNINPDSNNDYSNSNSTNIDENATDTAPPEPNREMGQPIPRISLRANVLNARAQLFDVFFRRVAVGYAHVFPLTARRIIEFGFLLQVSSVMSL
ncbi:hypothetical protein FBUS_02953 [Fasciolopsis buskii]|uniref:Uncharacterized protein n=1 Tax=Fasciolopsis buskii TaxID=27845 RepID=A0A8E0RSH2_9TREM|nr:hypothetical protein FBUS_02953 [Fasciolopsis buski]